MYPIRKTGPNAYACARRVPVEKLAATHGPTTFACPTLSIVSSARPVASAAPRCCGFRLPV